MSLTPVSTLACGGEGRTPGRSGVGIGRQLAIFSADSARPSTNDLAGLLIGPGGLERMGGSMRVSVRVEDAWRVHALAAEFAVRRLDVTWQEAAGGGFWVRTPYTSALAPLAQQALPTLDGAGLRLWYVAAGTIADGEVLLGLGDGALARPALAPLGLDGDVVRGLAIRICGSSKLARLAELIGDRPAMAPPGAWPG